MAAEQGALQIEIQSPSVDFAVTSGETNIEVEGIASAIGGVRYLDMIFVMDTSQSLRSTEVANGSLGSENSIFLPEGDYRVELNSSPPKSVQISLAPRDQLTLTLEKEGDLVSHFERRDRMEHRSCEDVVAAQK